MASNTIFSTISNNKTSSNNILVGSTNFNNSMSFSSVNNTTGKTYTTYSLTDIIEDTNTIISQIVFRMYAKSNKKIKQLSEEEQSKIMEAFAGQYPHTKITYKKHYAAFKFDENNNTLCSIADDKQSLMKLMVYEGYRIYFDFIK